MNNTQNGNAANEQGKISKVEMTMEQKIQYLDSRMKSQQEFSVQLIQILDQQTQALNSLQPVIQIENFNPTPLIQEIKEKFIKANIDLSSEQYNKLYEQVYCTTATLQPLQIVQSIEDKVDAKLDIVRELKTRVQNGALKLEQQSQKILQMEQSLSKLNGDLDQKPSKQELKHINEQVKISLTNLSNSLRLVADKDSVKYLLEKMQTLDKTMENIVTKSFLKEHSDTMTNQLKEEVLVEVSKQYESQAQSLDNMHKMENMNKKYTIQFEKFKEQNTLKIVNMDQLINDSRTKLLQKVDKNDYEEFKTWSQSYVHLSNINHVYEQIVPVVKNCKKDTENCIQKLKIFEVFMNNIDETLLFKCEKMELKKLETFIEDNFLQKSQFDKLENEIKLQHQNALLKFQKNYEESNKLMFSSTKSQLFPLIREEIQDQMQKYDQIQDKVADLIDSVQLELKKKADYSHIILLQNEKTSKKNTEQMHKDIKKMNQHIMAMSHNILNFMRQFLPNIENQSIQTRKKEIQNTIENVQVLFEKIHIQNIQINPASSTINQSACQNSRNFSPYERISLAKEIIKNGLQDEENEMVDRKASKPSTAQIQIQNSNTIHQNYQENIMKENYQTQSSNFMTVSTHTTHAGRSKTNASASFNSRPTTPQQRPQGNYKKTPSKGRPLKPLIQIQQQTQNILMQTISTDHIAQQEIRREIFEEQGQQLQNYYNKNYNQSGIRSKRETSHSINVNKASVNTFDSVNGKKNSLSYEMKEQYPQRPRSRNYSNNMDTTHYFNKDHKNNNNLLSQQQISADELSFINDDEGNFNYNKSQMENTALTFESHKQIKTCE